MKTKNKTTQRPSAGKTKLFSKPAYYFHADEDFREDWNWNNTEVANTNIHEQRNLTHEIKITC